MTQEEGKGGEKEEIKITNSKWLHLGIYIHTYIHTCLYAISIHERRGHGF